jgi:hypothetical protein
VCSVLFREEVGSATFEWIAILHENRICYTPPNRYRVHWSMLREAAKDSELRD